MTHDLYFIISPKPEFLSSLGTVSREVSEILSSSNLWTGQLPDKIGLTAIDTENLVKMLFLLNVSEMPEVSAAIGIADGGLSPSFFDKFWILNRIYEDGNIKESVANFASDARFRAFVESSGGAVQNFVDGVVRKF